MAEKITIRDIARFAGVSKATVSRVLNQKPDVDPDTRERILRIMEEQAFLPSITASRLAGGRSRLIGVLIPSLTWPLIPEIMRGVSEMVIQTPYELLLYSITHEQDRNEKDQGDVINRILATQLAASLLAVFPGQSARYLTRLHEQGFPIVMIDDQVKPTSIPWVSADNRRGGYAATRYLLQLGHRRIAHIQGPLKYLVSHERYQGYCEALSEAGITPDPTLVIEGDFMPSANSSLWKIGPPPYSLPVIRWPMARWKLPRSMVYGYQRICHSLVSMISLCLLTHDQPSQAYDSHSMKWGSVPLHCSCLCWSRLAHQVMGDIQVRFKPMLFSRQSSRASQFASNWRRIL